MKMIKVLGFFLLCLAAFPQQLKYDVQVVNIEVPVRVFDGDSFIDSLTIDDFEVYENGRPQKVQAVYLVKKTAITRREENAPFAPKTGRSFFFIFELYSYNPKLQGAIDYFVSNVLGPEDNLTIVTPVRTYRMKKTGTQKALTSEVANQVLGLVKRDILFGNTEYRSLLDEMKRMISEGTLDQSGRRTPAVDAFGSGSWEEFLDHYRDLRQRLENLRAIDDKRLFTFADFLKNTEGQKHVFLVYQREYIPVLDRKQYTGLWETGAATINEQMISDFDVFKRQIKFNVDKIKKAYSDASIAINFLFLTAPPENNPGLNPGQMEEHSEDIFSPFLEMAQATGGFAASSQNPASMMKTACEASENYYLLYYRPLDYRSDGTFKEIKVAVKNKGYRVLHRAGYFAK